MSILDDDDIILDSQEIIIRNWIEKNCAIDGNYEIINDEIYVYGNVIITNCIYDDIIVKENKLNESKLAYLPYKFKYVSGKFYCNYDLKSLNNCPDEVGGFDCSHCKLLSSLEGAPSICRGNFDCRFCDGLIDLTGTPKEIDGDLVVECCTNLKSLKGAPKLISGILYGMGTQISDDDIWIYKTFHSETVMKEIRKHNYNDYIDCTGSLKKVFTKEKYKCCDGI